MADWGNWNTGSVVAEVYKRMDDIPSALSGTAMNNDVGRAVTYVERYVGVSIGSTAIDLKYQSAILYKTCLEVLNSINAMGADGRMSLGDFSVNRGSGDNISDSIQLYTNLLKGEMSVLGRKFNYYKSNS